MRQNVRVRTAVTALATVATLGAAMLVAPAAFADEAPTCKLTASQPTATNPTSGGVSISGKGSRSGCVQHRDDITVRLRLVKSLWPDETLASYTVHDKINITISAAKWCNTRFEVPPTGRTVHTDISTNAGGSDKSSDVYVRDAVCD